jgi:hypothetical protein
MASDPPKKKRGPITTAAFLHAYCVRNKKESARITLELHHASVRLMADYFRDTGKVVDTTSKIEYDSAHSWGFSESKLYHESKNTGQCPKINVRNRLKFFGSGLMIDEYEFGMSYKSIQVFCLLIFQ